MLKRAFLPSGFIVALLALTLIGQEREQLTKPVFHVPSTDPAAETPQTTPAFRQSVPNQSPNETDALATQQRGPAPVLENPPATTAVRPSIPPAAVADVAPASPALTPQPTVPNTMNPVTNGGPVAEVASSIAPPSSPVSANVVPLSEAQQTLNLAIEDAQHNLEHIRTNVRDYTCLFIKQENVKGEVLPAEYMQLKVRNEQVSNGQVVVPFSVYCKFLRPGEVKNREVLYVAGRHGGTKLRVKEGSGARRFLPSIVLRVNSPLIMCTNRYPISEIGLINLTQRLIDRSTADPEVDNCEVTYRGDAKMDGRPCKFLQVKRAVPKVGRAAEMGMNVYLAQVLIDEELHVPIRYAAYDWPTVEGSRPEVVEMYTYKDLKLNVGLTDADFDHKNPAYNF